MGQITVTLSDANHDRIFAAAFKMVGRQNGETNRQVVARWLKELLIQQTHVSEKDDAADGQLRDEELVSVE